MSLASGHPRLAVRARIGAHAEAGAVDRGQRRGGRSTRSRLDRVCDRVARRRFGGAGSRDRGAVGTSRPAPPAFQFSHDAQTRVVHGDGWWSRRRRRAKRWSGWRSGRRRWSWRNWGRRRRRSRWNGRRLAAAADGAAAVVVAVLAAAEGPVVAAQTKARTGCEVRCCTVRRPARWDATSSRAAAMR